MAAQRTSGCQSTGDNGNSQLAWQVLFHRNNDGISKVGAGKTPAAPRQRSAQRKTRLTGTEGRLALKIRSNLQGIGKHHTIGLDATFIAALP